MFQDPSFQRYRAPPKWTCLLQTASLGQLCGDLSEAPEESRVLDRGEGLDQIIEAFAVVKAKAECPGADELGVAVSRRHGRSPVIASPMAPETYF